MGLLTGIVMAEECLEVKFTAQKKKRKKKSQLILGNVT